MDSAIILKTFPLFRKFSVFASTVQKWYPVSEIHQIREQTWSLSETGRMWDMETKNENLPANSNNKLMVSESMFLWRFVCYSCIRVENDIAHFGLDIVQIEHYVNITCTTGIKDTYRISL